MPSARANDSARHVALTYRHFALLFIVALAARAVWGAYRFRQTGASLEFPDEVDYWALGESLARTGTLVGEHGYRALRMPLYPAFLSLFTEMPHGALWAKAAQWGIGALSAVWIGLLGARVGGCTAGLLAGFLVAVDPFQIFFSSLLLTETLFVCALGALWLVAFRLLDGARPRWRHWCLLGVVGAACVYARESSVGLVMAITAFCVCMRAADYRAWIGACGALGVVIAALAPWAIRNARVTGHACWLTHRGGISLYDGVRPQATGASHLGNIKQMEPVRELDEAAWDAYFRREAWQCIKDDPGRIARLAVTKIARTWNPLPNVQTYQSPLIRLISAAWTIPVYGLAIFGVFVMHRRRAALGLLLLPAIYVTALHAVFVGSMRYRLPALPFLEILAAVGLLAIIRHRTTTPVPDPESPPDP